MRMSFVDDGIAEKMSGPNAAQARRRVRGDEHMPSTGLSTESVDSPQLDLEPLYQLTNRPPHRRVLSAAR
jgi:hypothetical protein